MNIGVLGAGNIGGTLGKKWAQEGHTVKFGVRDPGAPKVTALLAKAGDMATAGSLAEAIAFGEVVLCALPGRVMAETAAAHGEAIDGKIIIDATNQVNEPVMNNLGVLAAHAPRASLFRAFHNLGWENFADPEFGDQPADLFYCGDEGAAQETVEELIAAIGLRPVYVGGRDLAPIVDNLTSLWFALALRRGFGRHSALKLLTD